MANDVEARERALDLLRNHHVFPGPFEFRVVVRPPAKSSVIAAALAAAGGADCLENVDERRSSTGKYVSVRLKLQMPTAESVLDVYAVLQTVEGVVTML